MKVALNNWQVLQTLLEVDAIGLTIDIFPTICKVYPKK
jgi:hypothetical protein